MPVRLYSTLERASEAGNRNNVYGGFLDGVALTWFRQLYSESFEVASHGAALILWGAGLGLLFAFYLDQKVVR